MQPWLSARQSSALLVSPYYCRSLCNAVRQLQALQPLLRSNQESFCEGMPVHLKKLFTLFRRDQCMSIRKTLQPFTFDRGKTAHSTVAEQYNWCFMVTCQSWCRIIGFYLSPPCPCAMATMFVSSQDLIAMSEVYLVVSFLASARRNIPAHAFRLKSTVAGSRSVRALATTNTRRRRCATPKYWASRILQATFRCGP